MDEKEIISGLDDVERLLAMYKFDKMNKRSQEILEIVLQAEEVIKERGYRSGCIFTYKEDGQDHYKIFKSSGSFFRTNWSLIYKNANIAFGEMGIEWDTCWIYTEGVPIPIPIIAKR